MDEPITPDPDGGARAGTNGHGGAPDRERHRHSVYMTGVLARALTAQLEELAAERSADGWWFARSEHGDGAR